MNPNLDVYKEVNEVMRRLNNMHRWPAMVADNRYNELAKQALNVICSYIIASYCEKDGQEINWENLPKITMFRSFKRAYVWFEIPESNLKKICEIGNIDLKVFDIATRERIADLTNSEFAKFIGYKCNTLEYEIFCAGTKIATYVELLEQATRTTDLDEIKERMADVKSYMEPFEKFRGVREILENENSLLSVIRKISSLRNCNRWATQPYITDCSVLGHLYDTACFAYLIALEEFNDEKIATKFFFMGVFHDVAEAWTGDMPSDIKDRIAGLREATETYEDAMLNEHIYSKIPQFLVAKIKDVMFEDEKNLQYKTLIKGADYLSADSECWRQYVAGSKEPYFLVRAMKGFDNQLISGFKAILPPNAKALHNELMHYAEKNVKL